MDYREKIKKLLKLAESPNEHEAKKALLKAKELMMEHKLSEMDVKDVEKEVREVLLKDICASTRRNPWIIPLSTVIGENYCCKAFNSRYSGKQLRIIGFVGFEEDVQICQQVFRYAVDCVESKLKKSIKRIVATVLSIARSCVIVMDTDLWLVCRKPLKNKRKKTRKNGVW